MNRVGEGRRTPAAEDSLAVKIVESGSIWWWR